MGHGDEGFIDATQNLLFTNAFRWVALGNNKDNISLRDRFSNTYKIINKDNLMYIYDYKLRNIYDKKYYDMGINSLRYNKEIE